MHIVPACKQTYTLYSRDGQILAYATLGELANALDRAYRHRIRWIDEFVERFTTSGHFDAYGAWKPHPVGTWRAESPDGESVTREEIQAMPRARSAAWRRRNLGGCVGHFRDGPWPDTRKRRGYRYHRRPSCHQALAWQDAYREDFAEIGLHPDKIGRRHEVVTAYDDIPRSRHAGRASWKSSRETQYRQES